MSHIFGILIFMPRHGKQPAFYGQKWVMVGGIHPLFWLRLGLPSATFSSPAHHGRPPLPRGVSNGILVSRHPLRSPRARHNRYIDLSFLQPKSNASSSPYLVGCPNSRIRWVYDHYSLTLMIRVIRWGVSWMDFSGCVISFVICIAHTTFPKLCL